jgi:hypothetical protein
MNATAHSHTSIICMSKSRRFAPKLSPLTTQSEVPQQQHVPRLTAVVRDRAKDAEDRATPACSQALDVFEEASLPSLGEERKVASGKSKLEMPRRAHGGQDRQDGPKKWPGGIGFDLEVLRVEVEHQACYRQEQNQSDDDASWPHAALTMGSFLASDSRHLSFIGVHSSSSALPLVVLVHIGRSKKELAPAAAVQTQPNPRPRGMSSLADALCFRDAAAIPKELSLLLVDTLEAPSQFLCTHFINLFLREGLPCCVVSMNETLSHYAAISRKNVRLPVSCGFHLSERGRRACDWAPTNAVAASLSSRPPTRQVSRTCIPLSTRNCNTGRFYSWMT